MTVGNVLNPMKRVMIVGQPGSGKSTLAIRLGQAAALPVFHMDRIHYLPGWVERSTAEKNAMTQKIHAMEHWIFEGGHSATYRERISRADLFVWIDISLWRRVFRVIRRSYKYRGQVRPDMQDGCPEQFNRQTLDFLGFTIRTRKSARGKLLEIHKNPPDNIRLIRLTTQLEMDAFLEEVSK